MFARLVGGRPVAQLGRLHVLHLVGLLEAAAAAEEGRQLRASSKCQSIRWGRRMAGRSPRCSCRRRRDRPTKGQWELVEYDFPVEAFHRVVSFLSRSFVRTYAVRLGDAVAHDERRLPHRLEAVAQQQSVPSVSPGRARGTTRWCSTRRGTPSTESSSDGMSETTPRSRSSCPADGGWLRPHEGADTFRWPAVGEREEVALALLAAATCAPT